jgi:chromosomal replication initiation ATPase DnaA
MRTLRALHSVVSKKEFDTWLWPLEPELGEGGELRLVVPFASFSDVVKRRYGALIREVAGKAIPARIGSYADANQMCEREWRREFRRLSPEQESAEVLRGESRREVSLYEELEEKTDTDEAVAKIVSAIIEVVAETFGLAVEEMMAMTRNRSTLWPRQGTAYLARKLTRLSYPKLAAAFGNLNDHTTLIRAERSTLQRMDADEAFAKKIKVAERVVRERCGMRPASRAA